MVALRAALFGTKLKAALTATGLVVALVGGAFAVGALGTPGVVGVDNEFGTVTAETTTIETTLVVNNPNPVGVRLGGTTVNYTVTMNDIAMANGSKAGLAVERGNTSLAFSTRMRNDRIPEWWVSHIRNDERTELTIDARVRSSALGRSATVPHSEEIRTDVIGEFNSTETRPVNADQPVVSDPVLYVNRTNASWGPVTDSETPIDMVFTVYNPKTAPYTVTEFGYAITMNGIAVGEGATDETHVIPGGAEETIDARTTIRNDRLDEWWVSHLRNDQVTQLRIDFYAELELPSGETVRVPLDELTYTKEIETDVFGSGESEGSSDGNATTTPAPGTETASSGTETASPGTATPTPTPTAEPTPSDDETPTDDGVFPGIAGRRLAP